MRDCIIRSFPPAGDSNDDDMDLNMQSMSSIVDLPAWGATSVHSLQARMHVVY